MGFVRRSKVRAPHPLATWLERPGVERRFHAGVSVLALVAGPGYGKTAFAARLASRWDGPRFWYTFDEADADPAVFSAHLDAMLGEAVEGHDDARHLVPPREIGSRVSAALGRCKPPPLVVFDDVHVVDGTRTLAALAELVQRAARTGSTFVLCGRSFPAPLHDLASDARLARGGPLDLAFDESEAFAFLARTAPELGAAALAEVARAAEGWPAGLALAASAAARGALGGAPPTARDERSRRILFATLASHLLSTLTPRERALLLDTAILDELDVFTCDAVTERSDADELLASLARRGLFVARLSEDAYVADEPTRAFLRAALEAERSAAERAALHRRAAQAYATAGDEAGRVAHLLAAGDAGSAADALERSVAGMLAAGRWNAVARFLDALGTARVSESAPLLTALGRVLYQQGDVDAALASFERAFATARERARADAFAEAVRAAAPLVAGRGEYDRLRALLEETLALRPALSEQSVTGTYLTLGALDLETERFERAIETFNAIMPALVARGELAMQGSVLHNLAVAHVRRGDPYAGLALYERALQVKERAGLRASALLTTANAIFAHRLLGDVDEAERLTAQVLADAIDTGNAYMTAFAHESDGALKLARGDADGARAAYDAARRACDPSDVVVLPEILHGLAQADLARGEFDVCDDACVRALEILRATRRPQAAAPLVLTRAECALQRGDVSVALAFARDALDLAPDGADAVAAASAYLEAAALLVRAVPRLGRDDASDAERAASDAAAAAVALIHQRDYRFLLRTKAQAFALLHEHLRRWGVGAGLLPEAAALRGSRAMRVELFGGLRVFVDGELLPGEAWKRRKAREIFACLVSLRGRPVTRNRLVEYFFPETDGDAAHDNLRVTISAIRKAVGDVVKFETNAYRFAAPPGTAVDVALFDDHVDAARQAAARGDRDGTRRHYLHAADLYRGDFLEGSDDGGWQWRERERLRAACLEALRWLATDPDGEPGARRVALERLLERSPFDLDAVRMRLDVLAGDRLVAEARREYAEWRSRYRDAVGADAPDVWRPPGLDASRASETSDVPAVPFS